MPNELILYTTEDGASRIQLHADDGTVWLSQVELADLFQMTVPNINIHIKNILDDGELTAEATVKENLIVREEGTRIDIFSMTVSNDPSPDWLGRFGSWHSRDPSSDVDMLTPSARRNDIFASSSNSKFVTREKLISFLFLFVNLLYSTIFLTIGKFSRGSPPWNSIEIDFPGDDRAMSTALRAVVLSMSLSLHC